MGFAETHRKGSHVKMEHADGRRIVFPYHDEVDRFTLRVRCVTQRLIQRSFSGT